MKQFNKKVSNLLGNTNNSTNNAFIKEGMKATHETLSGNGALKYSTSGNDFVDDFASIAKYKEPRSYDEVAGTMQLLYSQDKAKAVKLAIFIRLITRKSQIMKAKRVKTLEEVQRGQGLKNEGIMRMLWLALEHPNVFKVNLPLFIAAGSWKDVITMMNLDLQFHGWSKRQLNWAFFGKIIKAGLLNPGTSQLVRKYLPTIRTNAKCSTLESQADTLIGRWLAKQFFPEDEKFVAYKKYRQLKAKGTAHKWQQLISKQMYDELNFDSIAGRALALLVGSKFLKNHNLEARYSEWIKSKPVAKYTGFVFELFSPLEPSGGWHGYSFPTLEEYRKDTINAQFRQLVKTGKDNLDTTTKLLVARDISGSMTNKAAGCNMSAYSVAKAMALYFSEFLTGTFANSYIEFASSCQLRQWKGNTPVDKWINDTNSNFGSTNFLAIADLFVSLKRRGVPVNEFPDGILCVSDGEFNYSGNNVTNFQEFRNRLIRAGFPVEYVENFKLILWDIPNYYYGKPTTKFEDFADAPNNFYISGYDPSVAAFILEGKECKVTPRNAAELMESALDQELLNRVFIPKK